jgi:tRNA pseudouridine55 synthase
VFGFLVCDKPLGMTSRDLVNIVTGRVRVESRPRRLKVGHSGTLDPLAQGVLVVGIGIASRLTPYVQDQSKRYRVTMRLGASSPSGDLEEAVTEHPELPVPTREELMATIQRFVGVISQTPPVHSAVRIGGKRGYEWARKGQHMPMPTRNVTIHEIQVLSFVDRQVEFDVHCGSGTYVRSLVIDLAHAMGTKGVMTALVRTAVGSFTLSDALTEEAIRVGPVLSRLRPLHDGVQGLPRLEVDSHDTQRLRNGLFVPASTRALDSVGVPCEANESILVDSDGNLRGIIRKAGEFWKPYRIFHEP